MARLNQQVAVVTGGGQGIGAATVRRFLREGAAVHAWDVQPIDRSELLDGLRAAERDRCRPRQVDITDAAAVADAVDAILRDGGRLDALINNAGVIADAFASDLTLEAWERVLRVSLTGSFICSQAVIPALREQQSGVIINTSSLAARGNRGQSNYAAAKAGVIGLTRTLALELARDGIRVNAVAPGAIDTAMFASVPEKVREKFLHKIPLGRLGRPADVAALHAFLASDDASYITGQTIYVDGGMGL